MTRVGILETGRLSDAVTQKHGDFPHMFHALFAPEKNLVFTTIHVADGEALPAIESQDAWLITGSPAAVYEDHPWILPLENFVRESATKDIRMLGICFGHQLMAQAMGGEVIKSPKGRAIGINVYGVTDAGRRLITFDNNLRLVATHQDQVVELPKAATMLAGSDFCPYAGLSYGEWGLSFQAHPEFTVAAGRDIARAWQEREAAPEGVLAKADATFNSLIPNATQLRPILGNFLSRRTLE